MQVYYCDKKNIYEIMRFIEVKDQTKATLTLILVQKKMYLPLLQYFNIRVFYNYTYNTCHIYIYI